MKMVSELTRQAMSRHRTLSSALPAPPYPPEKEAALSVPYVPSPQETTEAPAAPPQQPATPLKPAAQPRARGIYQQLMASHDRVNQRHVVQK